MSTALSRTHHIPYSVETDDEEDLLNTEDANASFPGLSVSELRPPPAPVPHCSATDVIIVQED